MGRVVFVGAGPGAADLITLRGAAALDRADVVLCDALADPALRALAPHATWIDVGKRGFTGARTSVDAGGGGSIGQSTINALLVRHAAESALVVRLKGGDPSVFGRLEEEIEALVEAAIDYEVVPGVTAALAAAAATARPLTRRGAGRSVALATAMTREGPAGLDGVSSGTAAPAADTEVFYMAGKQLGALARRLAARGWNPGTPISVVSRAGWPDALQSDHTVATLAQAAVLHAGRPTVVVVGVGASALATIDEARLRPVDRVEPTRASDQFADEAVRETATEAPDGIANRTAHGDGRPVATPADIAPATSADATDPAATCRPVRS